MRFSSPLLHGTLVRRYKRFLADIRLRNGRVIKAHCTNTGSMLGCNVPGSAVTLSRRSRRKGRLRYTWEMIRVGKIWVGINTFLPNRLVQEGIRSGAIAELQGYERVRREVKVRKGSRLDFCLNKEGESCFVEVKNVTLATEGVAAFPDAVSDRGARHLRELIRLRRMGHRAAIVFVIQRGDCRFFRPADEIDSEYGKWLRRAVRAGVEVLPYVAKVEPGEIIVKEKITLLL